MRETREGDVVHAEDFDTVLVVDFGAQYAQLIARRVRECHVYSEIVPATTSAEEILARRPAAVILSGGPASVYAEGAPPAPAGLLDAGVPVLGICYGFQLMVSGLGGSVAHTGAGEYGATQLELLPRDAAGGGPGAATSPGRCWAACPRASRSGCHTATRAPWRRRVSPSPRAPRRRRWRRWRPPGRGLYGVQFHPEVLHTEHGMEILRRFLTAARCRQNWTMQSIIDEQISRVTAQVGGARAICGLSGGSTPRWPPHWCSAPSGPG